MVQRISTKGTLLSRWIYLFNDILIFAEKKGNQGQIKANINVYLIWIKSLPDMDSMFISSLWISKK